MLKSKNEWRRLLLIIVCALALSFGSASAAQAQGSRGIRSEEVVIRIKSPIGGKRPPRRGNTRPKRPVTYSSDKPFTNVRNQLDMEYAQLGVTIWRLQGNSKELTQEGIESQTLEQVEATTSLSIGQSVRIGIEPLSRDGYLYVIDREQFADGTYGKPVLIFPTLRTRKGNNRVRVNQLIYIPMPPSYFRITPSRMGKTQVAEVLTILLSPTPLQLPVPISERPLTLDPSQVAQWEKLWGTQANRLEMEGGAGQTTPAISQTDGTKGFEQVGTEDPLTDDDPLPQTIFRAAIKAGNPLLVTVPLRFKAAN
ncbi:MAG TPA: hypothetical protein VF791_21395 [Pyrinomonadaceae bacterium]